MINDLKIEKLISRSGLSQSLPADLTADVDSIHRSAISACLRRGRRRRALQPVRRDAVPPRAARSHDPDLADAGLGERLSSGATDPRLIVHLAALAEGILERSAAASPLITCFRVLPSSTASKPPFSPLK